MSVQNTDRSYLGIAKEVTKGTAVAPTDYLAVKGPSIKPEDHVNSLFDDGLRGSLVKDYNRIPGRANSTFDFSADAFADGIGYPIAGLLGDVVTTGAGAPFTHAISLKNSAVAAADAQPIAWTLTDFYAAAVRAYPGCQFSDFDLKFNADGMLEYDAKTTGFVSAAAATPVPTFSTVLPTPVWQGVVSVAGVPVSNAVSGNISMKRPVNPIWGISNTQNPYSVFLGSLGVTGKVTFVMENDTHLTEFLTNTQPALTFNWTYGAGATLVQIQAQISKQAYTVASIDRSKDFVQVVIDIHGLGSTTDAGASAGYSAIKWTLQNAKVAGTYA